MRKTQFKWIKRKDGRKDLYAVFPNGVCSHPFAVIGEGLDGKFYYSCDTGGNCHYKRELTKEEMGRLIGSGPISKTVEEKAI